MPSTTTRTPPPPSTSKIPSTAPDSTHLPRLLCLHGGGVNASIFRAQSRSLIRHLAHSFRLVWAEGPFFCDPHPDVVHVYGAYAPFRRWLRWLPEHPDIDAESVVDEIGYALRCAMDEDEREGGRGEWVGLVGFSQGAKLAASLLLEQQGREELAAARRTGSGSSSTDVVGVGPIGVPGLHWRFGVLLAGRAPLSNLNPGALANEALVGAEELSEGFRFADEVNARAVLRTPTVHVHGMADPGLHLHRRLLHEYCAEGSTRLVEWEGAHRIPIKSVDVEPVVKAVYDVAEEVGVRVLRTV